MSPTGRFFTLILAAATLWIVACGGAQQPDTAPDPTTPASVVETVPPTDSAQGQTAPTTKATATTAPALTTAPVSADREVLLAVSRNLANGEEDPYYTP